MRPESSTRTAPARARTLTIHFAAAGSTWAGRQMSAWSSCRTGLFAWSVRASGALAESVVVMPTSSFTFAWVFMDQYPYPPPPPEPVDGELLLLEVLEVTLAVTGSPAVFSTYQVPPKLVSAWPLACPAEESPMKV